MRRTIAVASAALMAASLTSGVALAGKGKKGKHQHQEGSIAMMAPFPADPNSCYSGLHRRMAIFGGDGANGLVGYSFDVSKKTWNNKFKLKVTGGESVDLDITFYTEFGTQEQAADPGYAPASQSFEKRAPGGEKGKVPEGMNKAIVCMQQGGGASFVYKAMMK